MKRAPTAPRLTQMELTRSVKTKLYFSNWIIVLADKQSWAWSEWGWTMSLENAYKFPTRDEAEAYATRAGFIVKNPKRWFYYLANLGEPLIKPGVSGDPLRRAKELCREYNVPHVEIVEMVPAPDGPGTLQQEERLLRQWIFRSHLRGKGDSFAAICEVRDIQSRLGREVLVATVGDARAAFREFIAARYEKACATESASAARSRRWREEEQVRLQAEREAEQKRLRNEERDKRIRENLRKWEEHKQKLRGPATI